MSELSRSDGERSEGSFDLVVRNGRIIDPASFVDRVGDVAVSQGRIVEIGPDLAARATQVVDATGCVVTPGLVDFHVHAYDGVNAYSVDVDPLCQASGVTTALDAGSSGPVNFEGFERYVAARSSTRLLAFVAVAKHGVTRGPGDLTDLAYADPEGAARVVLEHPEVAVGIKIRLSANKVERDGRGARALELALSAGDRCEKPVMVHIGDTALAIEEIVEPLRPGDIVTHCFTPQAPCLTDDNGEIRSAVVAAHRRGVLFDVGHAGGHLGFRVARAAMDAGIAPDILSTDVHRYLSAEEAKLDLPYIMSKFLALGMPMTDVVAACTVAPARAIGWSDRLGMIAPGREADLTVLEEVAAQLCFRDAEGDELTGEVLLRPRWTVRAGHAYECGSSSPSARRELAFTTIGSLD